jgi:hypothetical protein
MLAPTLPTTIRHISFKSATAMVESGGRSAYRDGATGLPGLARATIRHASHRSRDNETASSLEGLTLPQDSVPVGGYRSLPAGGLIRDAASRAARPA